MKRSLPLLALALLTSGLAAQKIGSEAPDLQWERTFGFGDVASHKLSDLRGSVIVIEFWTTYSNTCVPEVARLNKWFADKGEQGLVVIGITGDDANLLPAWLKKNDVKYPCATAQSKEYRVTGIPDAIVIDKDFKIAWRGHPAVLENAGIDRLLVGAKPAIVVAGLEEANVLRRGGDFGGAWKKTRELLDSGKLSERAQAQAKDWITTIEDFVKTSMAAADEAEKAGDTYALWFHLDAIGNHHNGVPGAEQAKERCDRLLADPKQKREVEVGKKIAEAKEKEAAFDFDAAYDIYKAAANAFSSTKGGKAAAAAMKAIEKDGKLGYEPSCPYCKAGGAACPTHRKKKR